MGNGPGNALNLACIVPFCTDAKEDVKAVATHAHVHKSGPGVHAPGEESVADKPTNFKLDGTLDTNIVNPKTLAIENGAIASEVVEAIAHDPIG